MVTPLPKQSWVLKKTFKKKNLVNTMKEKENNFSGHQDPYVSMILYTNLCLILQHFQILKVTELLFG